MSFILDALRKSEHERHRQSGPTLAETTVAPARRGKNVWATGAIALLVVNLFAFGFLLLHMSRDRPAEPVVTAAPPASQPARETPDRTPVTRTRPVPAEPAPMMRPAQSRPAATPGRNPLEDEVAAREPRIDRSLQQGAAAPPEGPPAVSAAPRGGGSVIYQSLPEADPVTAASLPMSRTTSASLPTADEIMAPSGLPELKLELHVYSNDPAQRFVFINSHKYSEGENLAEGPRVEEIRSDGVVLSLRGSRFLLPRD
jgi:general secretion pathway protein B